MSLALGSEGRAQLAVTTEHLANRFIQQPEDDFPPVFATVHMIALMELAASRAMASLLNDGEISVGASVDVAHRAPTLLGDTVTATARFIGMDNKLYCFEVAAFDSGGEIGSGKHARAVVNKERLMSNAHKRQAAK